MAWDTKHGVLYKTMKYNNSCFPCCIQIILANMKICGQNDQIEDLWNQWIDLNATAPDGDQVLEYVRKTTLFNFDKLKIIVPKMLSSNKDDNDFGVNFQREAGTYFDNYTAMIVGCAHACVIYKKKTTGYVYIYPSRELASVFIQTSESINITAVAPDQGNPTHALHIPPFGGGDFIMLIG